MIGFDALGRVTVQGDRRGLGLRGSASSEFVPTLSQREEGTKEQEAGRSSERVAGRSSAVQTESLTLNRLNRGPVSITIERHPQVRFQVQHNCASINPFAPENSI